MCCGGDSHGLVWVGCPTLPPLWIADQVRNDVAPCPAAWLGVVRIRIYRVERMLGDCYHPLIPCQALGQAFDSSPIKGEGDNAVVLDLFTRFPRCGFWIKSRMTVPAPPPCGLTSLRSRCASVRAFSAEELRSSSFSSRKRPACAGMTGVTPLWIADQVRNEGFRNPY